MHTQGSADITPSATIRVKLGPTLGDLSTSDGKEKHDVTCVANLKKNIQVNLHTKQRHRKQTWPEQRGRRELGVWDYNTHTIIYETENQQDLPHSTGN